MKLKFLFFLLLPMLFLFPAKSTALNFDVIGPAVSNSSKVGAVIEDTVSDARGVHFDECSFINKSLSGNQVIEVRVVNPDLGNINSQAGLMIRQSLLPGSPYLAVVVNGNRRLEIRERWEVNGFNHVRGVPLIIRKASKFWLQIERRTPQPGALYTLYPISIKYSKNGVWEHIDNGVYISDNTYLGGVVSAGGQYVDEAVFKYRKLTFNPPLRLGGEEVKTEFAAFPNPLTDNLSINSGFDFHSVKVFTLHGILIKSINLEPTKKGKVDLSEIPAGTYFVRIYGETDSKNFRVLKL